MSETARPADLPGHVDEALLDAIEEEHERGATDDDGDGEGQAGL